jgi:hypothetical protein
VKENERGKKGGGKSWRMKHIFFSWLCSLKGRACLLACLSLFVRSLSLILSFICKSAWKAAHDDDGHSRRRVVPVRKVKGMRTPMMTPPTTDDRQTLHRSRSFISLPPSLSRLAPAARRFMCRVTTQSRPALRPSAVARAQQPLSTSSNAASRSTAAAAASAVDVSSRFVFSFISILLLRMHGPDLLDELHERRNKGE